MCTAKKRQNKITKKEPLPKAFGREAAFVLFDKKDGEKERKFFCLFFCFPVKNH